MEIYKENNPARYRGNETGAIHILTNNRYIRVHSDGRVKNIELNKNLTDEVNEEIELGHLVKALFIHD